jgi:16S rRNA (cytidine1402-2'-O)-methyltransferase
MLYIVPTPIGNLQDITLRALEILKQADFVLCEDTRQTKKLLDSFGIPTKTLRYNEQNEHSFPGLIKLLKEGKNLALVSDAGTPCVSDPGWKLVKLARQENIQVTALPGASAATCALSASGLSGGGFCFLGFLPKKKGKALKQNEAALTIEEPIVIYESPYRIVKFLEFLQENLPLVKVFIGREITKTFEEYLSGTPADLLADFKARKKILGEFVVILDGRKTDVEENDED